MENDRLDELYLPMGGLGGQKPKITTKNTKKTWFFFNINCFVPLYPLRVSTLKVAIKYPVSLRELQHHASIQSVPGVPELLGFGWAAPVAPLGGAFTGTNRSQQGPL